MYRNNRTQVVTGSKIKGSRSYRFDPAYQAKLNILSEVVINRLDELFVELDVDLKPNGNRLTGCCGIHGGSRRDAFSMYTTGYSVACYWRCFSKKCDEVFSKNILGFVRGRLSHTKLGYNGDTKRDAIYPFGKTVSFLCDFTGTSLSNIKVDLKEVDRRQFVLDHTKDTYNDEPEGIPIEKVRKSLILEPEFYLKRGYSREVLNKFCVGIAKKVQNPQDKGRIIVPVLDKQGISMCGYTSRAPYEEKCPNCSFFHSTENKCPESEQDKVHCAKWKHSGFKASETLFNYWGARESIQKTSIAILVEGVGDVLRLEQNNIRNSVATFGTTLHQQQERLLAKAGCMTLVCLYDNDKGGIEGAKYLQENYQRLYRLYFPTFSQKDVGELSNDKVTQEIRPLLKELEEINYG